MGAAEAFGLVKKSELGRHLRITACATQGGRKYMEDRVHIHVARTPDGSVDYTFAGVYDGHGGAEASVFARKHLLWTIVAQPEFRSDNDDDVLQAIQAGFLLCHAEMRKVVHTWGRTASGFTSTSGTTASVAFIMRGKIYTGHVGDSAIIIGRREGDLWSYNEESEEYVVSPRPDVEVVELSTGVESIVLGSDGLWNVVRPQQSVELVATAEARARARKGHTNHARGLVRAALRGWGSLRADNVTAVVVLFDHNPATPPSADSLLLLEHKLCPDQCLLDYPTAIVRVPDAEPVQVIETEDIELVYAGNMDPPLSALLSKSQGEFEFVGPGFTNYVLESRLNARLQGFARSPSLPSPKTPTASLVRTISEKGRGEARPVPKPSTPSRKRDSPDENRAGAKKPALDLAQSFAHGTFPSSGVSISRRPLPQTPSVPPTPDPTALGLAGKPKYFCRKHGYDCEKVRRMNLDYDRKRQARSPTTDDASEPEPRTPKRHHHSPQPTGSEAETKEVPESRVTRSHKTTPPPRELKASRSLGPSGPRARVHRRLTPAGSKSAPKATARVHRQSQHMRPLRKSLIRSSSRKAGGASPSGLEEEAPEEEERPRQLHRSPIRPSLDSALPPERPEGVRPEGVRKRGMSEDAAPPPKRSKLWNSIVSIFGAPKPDLL